MIIKNHKIDNKYFLDKENEGYKIVFPEFFYFNEEIQEKSVEQLYENIKEIVNHDLLFVVETLKQITKQEKNID